MAEATPGGAGPLVRKTQVRRGNQWYEGDARFGGRSGARPTPVDHREDDYRVGT